MLKHFKIGNWEAPLHVLDQYFEIMIAVWAAWVKYDIAGQSNIKILLEGLSVAWGLYQKKLDADKVLKVSGSNQTLCKSKFANPSSCYKSFISWIHMLCYNALR